MPPKFASILVSVTEKCHVGCAHCGFIGTTREREPGAEEIADWVGQAADYGVPLIIFTGGEPFERLECLARGMEAAHRAGTPSAVFTSSFWASTRQAARTILQPLIGLKHLYLSSDTFHQRRVPYQYIYNAIEAALDLWIPRITIYVTYTNETERAEVVGHYAPYADRVRISVDRVMPNPHASATVLERQDRLLGTSPSEYTPTCEIGTPIINPNGDIFSCHVGKAAAHRTLRHLPYFLGNLHETSFRDIIASAAGRLDYQFLRTHGPPGVAALFACAPGLMDAVGRVGFTTECDFCFSTLKTSAGRNALNRYVARDDVRDEIDMRLALIGGEEPLPDTDSDQPLIE